MPVPIHLTMMVAAFDFHPITFVHKMAAWDGRLDSFPSKGIQKMSEAEALSEEDSVPALSLTLQLFDSSGELLFQGAGGCRIMRKMRPEGNKQVLDYEEAFQDKYRRWREDCAVQCLKALQAALAPQNKTVDDSRSNSAKIQEKMGETIKQPEAAKERPDEVRKALEEPGKKSDDTRIIDKKPAALQKVVNGTIAKPEDSRKSTDEAEPKQHKVVNQADKTGKEMEEIRSTTEEVRNTAARTGKVPEQIGQKAEDAVQNPNRPEPGRRRPDRLRKRL